MLKISFSDTGEVWPLLPFLRYQTPENIVVIFRTKNNSKKAMKKA
jgi:hypothetical protein